MKSKISLAVATALLAPALAFAAPKNSANVRLDQPVTVAGTQLAPGQYKLTWQGSGSEVTVTFVEGKKTIATVPAKLASNRNNQDAIETNTVANNTVLRAIDVKDLKLQFDSASPAAGN